MKQEPQGFAEFWQIWSPIKRRNDGRADARATYTKHIKAGVDPQDIIDGASWYVRNTPPGYEYVPYAATWMNRGVWEDDCIKERESRERRAENVVQMRPIEVPKSKFLQEFEAKRKQG
jgi:hypothetical protein